MTPLRSIRSHCHVQITIWLHRSTKLTKFFVLKQNPLFSYNFGSLSPNPASVFSITSEFCSIANFMVARSENQFFSFCEKIIRDIENLIAFKRIKIKFCAFWKKEIENQFSRSRDIGHLSWRNRKKQHFSAIFFVF